MPGTCLAYLPHDVMSFIQLRAPRRFEGLFLWELQRTLHTDQWIVNVATGVALRSSPVFPPFPPPHLEILSPHLIGKCVQKQ